MNSVTPSLSPIIIILLVIVFALVVWNFRTRFFDYQCGICGAKFNLNFPTSFLAIHMMGRKFIKCPHCGQWTWADPVPKE